MANGKFLGRLLRMSTDHDIPGDTPVHGDSNTQSRRPSTESHKFKPTKPSKSLKSSDSLASQNGPRHHDSTVAPIVSPLNLQDVLREADAVKDNPDNAREWLRSLGSFAGNSDASTRLRNLLPIEGQPSEPTTFLSVLARWLALWFAKVEKARRDYKSSRTSPTKEQNDLDWLFQFTQDYLQLGHESLPEPELAALLASITDVCLKTNRQSDINHALDILYTVLRYFDFPKESLEPTLIILSASLANLVETPKHLHDCFDLLAIGTMGEEVVNILFEFIRTPSSENNAKNLSHARGATRLLRSVVHTRGNTGDYVYTLQSFANALDGAAKQGIFRFCVDILQGYHTLLSTEERISEILSLDFGAVTETLRLCLAMKPSGKNGSVSLGPVTSPQTQPDDESEKPFERHFRDRDLSMKAIATDLEILWPSISESQMSVLNAFVLSIPQHAISTQLLRSIRNLADDNLLLTTSIQEEETLNEVLSGIIQGQSVDRSSRLEMLRVLDETVSSLAQRTVQNHSPATGQKSQDFQCLASRLSDVYMSQATIEPDKVVLEALLISLQRLVNLVPLPQSDGNISTAYPIIENLKELIVVAKQTGEVDDDYAFYATRTLTQIFQGSLHSQPEQALHAYGALLEAVSLQCQSRRSRIEAMRVLYRIRADANGSIYFLTGNDSESIATALCRTRESAEAFNCEIPTPQRHSASSTSLSAKSTAYEPLWMIDDFIPPFATPSDASRQVLVESTDKTGQLKTAQLDITSWLLHVIRCLQSDTDWETYSYTLIHLGSQLSNMSLFSSSLYTIVKMRQILCEQIVNGSFKEPPTATGLKKSDVALCLFNILTPLISYATIRREPIQKGFGDDLVRAFLTGIGGVYEGTSRGCIHALSVCSLEIPSSVASLYPNIVDKLSKNMTQSHLTMYILEFLSQVASLPEVHSNFNQDEIITIFGICIQFLEKTREQNQISPPSQPLRMSTPARQSGINSKRPPYRAAMMKDVGFPQYAAALAYHTMIFWFLSLKLDIRAKYVSWIVPRLVWKNPRGEETIDEQSQVFTDMMQRTAFSDLGETLPNRAFAQLSDGPVTSASWVVGLSIVTAETAGHTGLTQITKRQASGTTYAIYQQLTTQLPSHHAPSYTEIKAEEVSDSGTIEMLPSHILLQMVATAAPTSVADQPVPLPKEDYVTRALEAFDRIPTVDSHKIGVLYIGEGQNAESQFLANQTGSLDYDRFLHGLGYTVSLEPPLRFNPQGLEFPRDGKSTIAWRDRITEIIFHVPTMMPTDVEEDPQCVTKKSHVGNCHVNIIFNRSGELWNFDNFRSQLNYVNIVITPANRCESAQSGSSTKETSPGVDIPDFYMVHVLTKDDLPNISPAADPKIISAAQLPQFVRVLALNANVFSQAWNSKDYDKEFPSPWRARLQQIKMLKDRVLTKSGRQDIGSTGSGATIAPAAMPTAGGRRTPVPRDDMAGGSKDGVLALQLDFGKWSLRGNDGTRIGH